MIDAANPYASIGFGYDSNLYRLDDEVPVPDGQSDEFAVLGAGFDADLQVSQQRYELAGLINHTLFNTYDDLDYTGGKFTAIWHWRAGEPWDGTLGYRYKRSLRDFANQTRVDKIKDLRSEHQLLAGANYDLPGNWKVGVRSDIADITFSDTDTLDIKRTTFGAAADYISSAGNLVGLDAEFVNGDYDRNPEADFDEYFVGPKVEWKFTGRTQLEAKIGYTARDYNSRTRTDYDGITGRAALILADNGRNTVRAEAYRDLSNLGDEIAEYAVVNGVSIEPSWTLTETVNLRVNASYETRDFRVDQFESDREDDVYTAGAFVDWDINRNIALSLGVDGQRRSSTRELQDYEFNRFQVQIVGRL